MEVIILGSGTGVPRARRASPGLAVVSESTTILIDSGPGTLRQLDRAGLSCNDLDFIFYTHFHPDHTADLLPFIFATKYLADFKRETPVFIYGPEGLKDIHKHLTHAFGKWAQPAEGTVIFNELPRGRTSSFTCGDVRVQTGPIPHNPESLGYRLTGPDGRVLVVSGDSDFGPGLVDLSRGADLLITECSFPDDLKKEGHLTPSLAGRAAREAGVGGLALTHFYPETDGTDLAACVRSEYGGILYLADDLMRIRV